MSALYTIYLYNTLWDIYACAATYVGVALCGLTQLTNHISLKKLDVMQSQLLCRTLSDLPPMPCQLSECCLVFPKWAFKKQNVMWQSFQQSWFTQWAWLHYDEMNNLAHCRTCITAFSMIFGSAGVATGLNRKYSKFYHAPLFAPINKQLTVCPRCENLLHVLDFQNKPPLSRSTKI